MSYDIHEIAEYLKIQRHPTAQRLYGQLAEEFGYNITDKDLKKKVEDFLAEEQKIYRMKDPVDKQKAMILLNGESKKFRIKIEKMPKVTEKTKDTIQDVIEKMVIRLAEEILGVKLDDFKNQTPVPDKKHFVRKGNKLINKSKH